MHKHLKCKATSIYIFMHIHVALDICLFLQQGFIFSVLEQICLYSNRENPDCKNIQNAKQPEYSCIPVSYPCHGVFDFYIFMQ